MDLSTEYSVSMFFIQSVMSDFELACKMYALLFVYKENTLLRYIGIEYPFQMTPFEHVTYFDHLL